MSQRVDPFRLRGAVADAAQATPRLQAGEIALLWTLWTYSNRTGLAWPGIRRLSADLGFTERHTMRLLKSLKAHKLIESVSRTGSRGPDQYRITTPDESVRVTDLSPDESVTPTLTNRSLSPDESVSRDQRKGTRKNKKEKGAAPAPARAPARDADSVSPEFPEWAETFNAAAINTKDPLTPANVAFIESKYSSLDKEIEVEKYVAYWTRRGTPKTYSPYLTLLNWLKKAHADAERDDKQAAANGPIPVSPAQGSESGFYPNQIPYLGSDPDRAQISRD